jgi:hypothetical protein
LLPRPKPSPNRTKSWTAKSNRNDWLVVATYPLRKTATQPPCSKTWLQKQMDWKPDNGQNWHRYFSKSFSKRECHGAELKTPSDNTLKQKKKT